MQTFHATAWTADWLVAWLASIGVTYRDPSIQLSWTDEVRPCAVFYTESAEALAGVLPSTGELSDLAITRHLDGVAEFPRKPSREEFAERAHLARCGGDYSLGATVSDIGVPMKEDLPHSPFDAAVPKGVTLSERAAAARGECESDESVLDSMTGNATASSRNGLGFDLWRLSAAAVPGESLVTDPFVETLALFGAMLFTQTGRNTRGWHEGSQFSTGAFTWPAWQQPLDFHGVDALLDRYFCGASLGIGSRLFKSIAYRPTASADTTRGYAGIPLQR